MIYGIISIIIEFLVIMHLINRTQKNSQAINELRQQAKPKGESNVEKCCKRRCQEPAYEFGMCFKHYMDGEMRTGV